MLCFLQNEGKNLHWKKDYNWFYCGGLEPICSICKVYSFKLLRDPIEIRPPTYIRINSKWVKDFNISHDTTKILVENIGSKISDFLHSNIFADVSAKERETKEK